MQHLMGIPSTVRIMAVLLAGLLCMQLDPGGAVICLADSGRISYSFSCTCDLPGEHQGGCSACGDMHSAGSETASCCAESELPACCRTKAPKQNSGKPRKKSCCHNIRLEVLSAGVPSIDSPQWELAQQQLPLPILINETDCVDWSEARHAADLPPPLPERSCSTLSQLSCIRLLL